MGWWSNYQKMRRYGVMPSQVAVSDTEMAILDGATVTTAELNKLDDSANTAKMSASTVMAATLAAYQASTFRYGNIIETTIYIDLTGAKSTATNKDIIGDTGACHIGQITTAVNGVIFAGEVHCAEVPTTGDDDIDIYQASVATGAYDADASGLTNAAVLVTGGGAHAIGTVQPFTALPTANYYLYLATGDTTAGTYDAGIIVIKLWGLAA